MESISTFNNSGTLECGDGSFIPYILYVRPGFPYFLSARIV
jgi:hypothetical protein